MNYRSKAILEEPSERMDNHPDAEPIQEHIPGHIYVCGTLRYTRAQLFKLFAWLLWGDFCFMLMQTVVPVILPLKLKHLDAPNWVIALIISTLPGILNMTICPWVSFKSDRHRGRLGRRIPFILCTLPFLSAFLILLGYSSQLGSLVHSWSFINARYSSVAVTVTCIGIFMVGFQFFNMFVNSVFWYLFNDVVPAPLMGRFLGFFRIVVGIKTILFNFFILKYAESHMTEIFLGATLLYAIGFGLMCLNVKEGQYPPPVENVDGKSGFLSELKTYSRECYSQKYYWNLFLYTCCWNIAFTIGLFVMFAQQDLGLSLAQIGTIAGINSIVGLVLTYPAGALGDRFHPLRVLLWSHRLQLAAAPLALVWLFYHPSVQVTFILCIVFGIIGTPASVCIEAATLPMHMRVLPHDRFGQFASAQSMVRSAGTILGGGLAGIFMDATRALHHESNFGYRYYPVWILFWSLLAYWFLTRLYQDWQKQQNDVKNKKSFFVQKSQLANHVDRFLPATKSNN